MCWNLPMKHRKVLEIRVYIAADDLYIDGFFDCKV